jgi:hypothetical protein
MNTFKVSFSHNNSGNKHYNLSKPIGTECSISNVDGEVIAKGNSILSPKDKHFNKAVGRAYSFMHAIASLDKDARRAITKQSNIRYIKLLSFSHKNHE